MKFLIMFLILILSSFQVKAADGIHGMVVFGKEKLYAYHLPMFHKMHNKQMVITFEVPQSVKDQLTRLQETQFLTFVPAPFDLEKFIERPFDLKGDLYSGHFEKDGVVVMEDITISGPSIVYLKEIIRPVGRTEGYKSEVYTFFGTKNDSYALHLIDGATAKDQIFKLTATEGSDESIEFVLKFHSLNNKKLLQPGESFTFSTPPGRCPSRLCGDPGRKLATFKAESIYFEDEVM